MKKILFTLCALVALNSYGQNIEIRRGGGGSSVNTNTLVATNQFDSNQFTFDTALHIKSGATTTNMVVYGAVVAASSNIGVNLVGGSTSAVNLSIASVTNSLAGAITYAHATNGVDQRELTSVVWLWAGGSDRTLTIPAAWKTNVNSAVPPTITNGTITKMYVTSVGDTSSSANQSNVFVSFEYYK